MIFPDSKIKWKVASHKGCNFENFIINILAIRFAELYKSKAKPFGPIYGKGYRQFDSNRSFPKNDVENFLARSRSMEAKKPGSILKSYYNYERAVKNLVVFAKTLDKINFSTYSNRSLVAFLKRYVKIAGKTIDNAYNIYFYQFLGEDLYNILQQKEKDLNKQSKYFTIFTQATELSLLQQEKRDLVKLAIKVKNSKQRIDSSTTKSLIDKHLQKYGYMGFHFYKNKPWTSSYVVKRLRPLLRKKDLDAQLKEINDFNLANKNWEKLANKLGLTKKDKMLIRTLKMMAYTANLFDEEWNFFVWTSQPMLAEIRTRIGVSYRELIEMGVDEILELLNNNEKASAKLRKKLQERIKDSALIMLDGKTIIFSGKELAEYRKLQQKKEQTNKKIGEMKGQPASTGKAKGKVAIVNGVDDLSKVKKGNIMVSQNTVPSFLPAMEKASGIATETGGLLCHAAIVSRELKIPCVVGINSLLEIIKDGDMVELDATKGKLKKIK